jgi:hypothetical protein
VPEHFLDVMDRPACFEPATACLVPEIMKMQIDGTKSRAGFLSEPVGPFRPLRFVAVGAQHAGLPGLFDLADPGTKLANT